MTRDDWDVIYRVDASGRLTYVNEGWEAFAVENRAPELTRGATLGRPLIDFISGPETRHIYERILARARAGVRLSLPFRCDSPTERRRMSLTVVALGGDEVEFRSRLLNAELRDSVTILEVDRPRSDALLTLCSWCNRGRLDDRWAEIEDVVAELRLFDAAVPQLTHGMCPTCLVEIGDDLAS